LTGPHIHKYKLKLALGGVLKKEGREVIGDIFET